MSTYTVKPGESISDIVLNSTGSLANWDTILTANNFTDWVPELFPGQVITIPDDIVNVDQNTVQELSRYPACNNFIDRWLIKIDTIFDIIFNNWILKTGFWMDKAIWIDTKTWID